MRNICIIESQLSGQEFKQQLMECGVSECCLLSEVTEKSTMGDKGIIVREKEVSDPKTLEQVLYFSQWMNREVILLVWDFDKFKTYFQKEYRKMQNFLFMIKKNKQSIYLGAEMYRKLGR